jgi:hypothetical protein
MSDTILRYKYVPLDDSFKKPPDYKDGSLCIIKVGTIKFTHPKDFNDPFDCYPDMDAKAYSNSLGKDKELMKLVRKTYKTAAQYIENTPKRLKQLENTDANKFCATVNNKVGICSLSRNPLNLLMWAHYASSHTGFVVEFVIPTEQILSLDNAINCICTCLVSSPVIYKKEKPIIKNNESFDEHFLTKGEDWEYEQEERVIDHYRKAGIHAYDRKRILKSVIAGMRMSDDDFAVLKNTVDQVNKEFGINVTVHRAEPLNGKFALFVPDRDDLNIHNN